jgi:hypothetical protein
MNGETAIRAALEATMPRAPEPNWDDVLRRAGRTRVGMPRRPAALAAAVALVALLVAVPAFGLGDGLRSLVTGDSRPHLTLSTTLTRANGTPVGSFAIRAAGVFATRPHRPVLPRVFRARKSLPIPLRLDWTLNLVGSSPATEALLEGRGVGQAGRILAVVCRPCRPGRSSGSLRLRIHAFSLLFGHAVVVVKAPGGTARGVIHLQLPPRKR